MPSTIARFQLLESVGRNALGELHRARDLQSGRTVALRVIAPEVADDPSALSHLFDAARRASAASHPALAAIYDCGVADGRAYLATEFVPGQHLSAVVAGSPLNRRRALDLAAQVADGLAVAHAHGLSHGALDAGAVLVTPKGAAKLLDVGMTAWTRAAAADPSDDFAAVGALLFEMLVGRPLKGGWPGELRVPQVPADVRPVLERLTLARPADRFDSMATLAGTLRAIAGEFEPGDAAPKPPQTAGNQPARSHRTAVVVVLGAAVAAALWWFTR